MYCMTYNCAVSGMDNVVSCLAGYTVMEVLYQQLQLTDAVTSALINTHMACLTIQHSCLHDYCPCAMEYLLGLLLLVSRCCVLHCGISTSTPIQYTVMSEDLYTHKQNLRQFCIHCLPLTLLSIGLKYCFPDFEHALRQGRSFRF